MTCKDNCLHYEVCQDFKRNICTVCNLRHAEFKINRDGLCDYFKDKSKYIELPCKVGDTVYVKGVPLIISFLHIESEVYFVIQFDCDDCFKCPFYEDEVSFEGEHDCRTRGYLEFSEKDIGKTVFLTKSEAEAKLKEQQDD
ncbi:MAG: hypothetical protein NC397_09370 [Clostridium sp.]|nr:hypothetical protein [Clostridium sp.]